MTTPNKDSNILEPEFLKQRRLKMKKKKLLNSIKLMLLSFTISFAFIQCSIGFGTEPQVSKKEPYTPNIIGAICNDGTRTNSTEKCCACEGRGGVSRWIYGK
jgi:hypothetical protein